MFDNLPSGDDRKSLPFVQRVLISNYSDRLKISSFKMSLRDKLDLNTGISLTKKHPKYVFLVT